MISVPVSYTHLGGVGLFGLGDLHQGDQMGRIVGMAAHAALRMHRLLSGLTQRQTGGGGGDDGVHRGELLDGGQHALLDGQALRAALLDELGVLPVSYTHLDVYKRQVQAHLRTALLDGPMIVISTLGNAGLIWIALGVVLTAIPKTRKYRVLALVSLLVCFLFNNMLLKNLVARPRPYTQLDQLVMLMPCPADHSFPSGHACSSFATAGSLCLLYTSRCV